MQVVSDTPRPVPKAGQVLIKVSATAVNRADTLQRKGLYPPPPGASDILGLEASGVVEAFGPECKENFKLGQTVMALLGGGGYAEYVVVHEDHIMALPEGISVVNAAGIPEAWLTAYQILHFVGDLKKDDVVVVHAGGSGVGTSLIQLALLEGATVFVTSGSERKRQFAVELGAKAAFPRGDEWADQVLEATDGVGATLVLDCIGASYWAQNVKSVAKDGRIVVYGLMGGREISGPVLGQILAKRLTITGTTLRTRSDKYKAELVAAFVKNAIPHFKGVDGASPKLTQVIDRVMALEEVVAAHDCMEADSNLGKIIMKVD